MKIVTDEGSAQAGPGDWVLPRQGARRQKFLADTRLLSVHLHLHWPGGKPLFDWPVALVFPSARFPRFEVKTRRLERFVQKEFPGAGHDLREKTASLQTDCRLRNYFSAWLEAFTGILEELHLEPSHMESIDARALAVAEYLDHISFSEPCREEILGARVGLSVSQLNRLFLRHFGLTPRRYFERRRLENALVQVRRSRPLKEIAYDLGFKSLPHFSYWFRQKTGHSPAASVLSRNDQNST